MNAPDNRDLNEKALAVTSSDRSVALTVMDRLRSRGTSSMRLRPRRGQRIEIEGGGRSLWLVEAGCLLLQHRLPVSGRQIILVLLPGDGFDAAWTPMLPGLELVASTASEVLKIQPGKGAEGGAARSAEERSDPRGDLARHMLACLARHAACLGRLSGEERVASFLLGLAQRQDASGSSMRSLTLPLSRRDVGDCLALNPDTVSRILSDLRRRRVLSRPSRNELVIVNWDALAKLSPFERS